MWYKKRMNFAVPRFIPCRKGYSKRLTFHSISKHKQQLQSPSHQYPFSSNSSRRSGFSEVPGFSSLGLGATFATFGFTTSCHGPKASVLLSEHLGWLEDPGLRTSYAEQTQSPRLFRFVIKSMTVSTSFASIVSMLRLKVFSLEVKLLTLLTYLSCCLIFRQDSGLRWPNHWSGRSQLDPALTNAEQGWPGSVVPVQPQLWSQHSKLQLGTSSVGITSV